jgi:hypothetical protein
LVGTYPYGDADGKDWIHCLGRRAQTRPNSDGLGTTVFAQAALTSS